MRRVASAIVSAFLSGAVALLGYAQTPSRDIRARQTGTGVIRGRILSATTDAPLRNSRVALTFGTGTITAVFTDRDGRFSFTRLAEGQYGLTIKKSGSTASTSLTCRFPLAPRLNR
jgi:Carboxypeptidase regulatory-like domain